MGVVIYMDKRDTYATVLEQLRAMLANEDDMITLMANTSALLMQLIPDISWVGFYLKDGSTLTLGPFQGRPACEKIKIGSGVCGSCAVQLHSLLVPDVHQFSGHISCDPRSNSEIVVPLMAYGELFAVLDVDSTTLGRFDRQDQQGLEDCAQAIQDQTVRIIRRQPFTKTAR